MKLPFVSGAKPAAEKLQEAEAQLATAQAKLLELESERSAVLAGEEFQADELARLSSAIFDGQSLAQDLHSRIEILRLKVAAEAAQQRQEKREADWAALEPLLNKRAATACKIGNQLREAADMVKQLNEQTTNIVERFLPLSDVRIAEAYLQPPGPLLRQIAAVDADTVNDWISELMTGHDSLKADWHFEAPAKEDEAA